MYEDMFEMQYSELHSVANEAVILEKCDEISLQSKIV